MIVHKTTDIHLSSGHIRSLLWRSFFSNLIRRSLVENMVFNFLKKFYIILNGEKNWGLIFHILGKVNSILTTTIIWF